MFRSRCLFLLVQALVMMLTLTSKSVVVVAFLMTPTTPYSSPAITLTSTTVTKSSSNSNRSRTLAAGDGFPFSSSSSSSTLLMGKADDMSEEEYAAAMEKATKAMTAFTNKYLKNSETTLCSDKSVPAAVIKGLAEHKVNLGAPLCPCRFYEDKEAEVKDGYWNCPCVPMREEKVCHCCLFLTEDNPFAGKEQVSFIHFFCFCFVFVFKKNIA